MPQAPTKKPTYEELLHDEVAQYYADPLGFVLAMFPWKEPGRLEQDEPDVWQRETLIQIGKAVKKRRFDGTAPVEPLREAISSGHGIGKSARVAWLVLWIMSTRPFCQGTVTANTITQLDTKTWAAIQSWTKLCKTAHWFEINAERMWRKGHKENWFCAPQSSKEQNSEAFAGQHAKTSTSFYVFDEAAAIPQTIYEVAEGGMTDGEPMIFLSGNATRNSGPFYRRMWGNLQHRWMTRTIDSRDAKFPNKELIAEWIADFGEDSDFVRVRVKGLPPTADDSQFIDSTRVYGAQKRPIGVIPNEPLIAGVDVSGGGAAWTVCRFRRGLDARTLPPIRLTGEQTVKDDRQLVISLLAERLQRQGADKIAAMFIDSAFGSPLVVALRNRGFQNVFEINFGGPSPNVHQANQRAYQWNKMKDWLPTGSIPADDTRLEGDLMAPGFHLNNKDQLVLESKESMQKRGVASPDDGDALSLTFAQVVQLPDPEVVEVSHPRSAWS